MIGQSIGHYRIVVLLALVSTGLLLSLPVVGQSNWPQWRGPTRDGAVAVRPGAHRGAGDWPEQPTLVWKRVVGTGYSGPVAARDRIWVHARQVEQEVVRSLDFSTGKILWVQRYDAPFEQDSSALAHGRGPYSTPTLADDRLLTLGVTAILSVWDADSGTLLWRRDYSEEFDPSHMIFGAAASPLVEGGLCFVHFGDPAIEDPGSSGSGAMIALRIADGEEVWRWTGDSPAAGATPVIHDRGGLQQLIFKTRASIVGVDPHAGGELWRMPFRVLEDNTITTPLIIGDRLVTSDYEVGVFAWRLEAKGGSWTVQELWSNREVSLFMSSPVVVGAQVIGFSHQRMGQLFGLDLEDGRVLWLGERRWGEHATLVVWGDALLVFLEDGSLVVGEVSRKGFQELRRYRLGEKYSWSHPAIVGDRILVRSGKKLAVYHLGE